MPVVARLMKLTIMQAWSARWWRAKRTNSRSGRGGAGTCVCAESCAPGSQVLFAFEVFEFQISGHGFRLISILATAPFSSAQLPVGAGFLGAQFTPHLNSLGQPQQCVNSSEDEG